MAAPRKPEDRTKAASSIFDLDAIPDAKPFVFKIQGKTVEIPGEPTVSILEVIMNAEEQGLTEDEAGSKLLAVFISELIPDEHRALLRAIGKDKLVALLKAWSEAVGLGE